MNARLPSRLTIAPARGGSEWPPATPAVSDNESNAPRAIATEQSVIEDEQHDSTDDRNNCAVKIQPAHTRHSKHSEQPPSEDCSDDPKKNVDDDALTGSVDDLAGDEARNES